ncbi:MAG: hypothetical protein M3014_04220 [Chloroflexota bacterium]|nr:hypothetical protein [Chloroflexota bacterium]
MIAENLLVVNIYEVLPYFSSRLAAAIAFGLQVVLLGAAIYAVAAVLLLSSKQGEAASRVGA